MQYRPAIDGGLVVSGILLGVLQVVEYLQFPAASATLLFNTVPFILVSAAIVFTGVTIIRDDEYGEYATLTISWGLGRAAREASDREKLQTLTDGEWFDGIRNGEPGRRWRCRSPTARALSSCSPSTTTSPSPTPRTSICSRFWRPTPRRRCRRSTQRPEGPTSEAAVSRSSESQGLFSGRSFTHQWRLP